MLLFFGNNVGYCFNLTIAEVIVFLFPPMENKNKLLDKIDQIERFTKYYIIYFGKVLLGEKYLLNYGLLISGGYKYDWQFN